MKLTRTAWNNVIIFAVMGMILVINLTSNSINTDNEDKPQAAQVYLIPESKVLLTLSIGDHTVVERVGTQWRSNNTQLGEQALSQMMRAWQQTSGLLQADQIDIQGVNPIVVTMALAGDNGLHVLDFYPLADQVIVHQRNKDSWIAISPHHYRQMMPAH